MKTSENGNGKTHKKDQKENNIFLPSHKLKTDMTLTSKLTTMLRGHGRLKAYYQI